MHRYEYEYSKEVNLLSSKWVCYLRDLKTDNSSVGYGETKYQAKKDAIDSFWEEKRFQSSSNNSYQESVSTSSSSDISPGYKMLIVAILCGLIAIWGYDFFQEAKHASRFTIKGGLGPLFGIISMAGGTIGCILFIFLFLSTLSKD